MRPFRSRATHVLGEHAIFGNEEAAQLCADVQLLTARVAELTERVNAQFTSISAHAEIARDQIEHVRVEARSDMERSRETIIGLIDRLRDEFGGSDPAGNPGAPSIAFDNSADRLERTVDELAQRLDDCLRRQDRMAETMMAFIDTMLSAHQDEPLLGLALT